MQAITPESGNDQIARIENELDSLSNEEVVAEAAKLLALSVEMIIRWAALFRIFERRGLDLSLFRRGLAAYAKRVAYGHVDPEIVVKFFGKRTILNRAKYLPLPEQRRIVNDEPIKVVISHGGGFDSVMIRPTLLSPEQAVQVFGEDHVRSEDEQIAYIRQRQTRPKAKASFSGIAIDRRKKSITVVSGRTISLHELTEILNELVAKK